MECREAQILLLDPSAIGLTNGRARASLAAAAALERHLAECPECRASAETARVGTELMTDFAAAAARPAPLSNEIEQRVRLMAHDRLTRSRKAVAGGEIPPRLAPRGGRIAPDAAPARSIWLQFVMARPVWGIAAALGLIVVAGFGAKVLKQAPPMAAIEFSQGTIQVTQAGKGRDYTNVQQAVQLASAASLSTGAKGEAFFTLGAARVAMAENTALAFDRPDVLALTRGQVWLQVDHTGKGFRVESPRGVVNVTGTRFGVTIDPAGSSTLVEVVEGTVVVTDSAGQGGAPVSTGQQLSVAANVGSTTARKTGTDLPEWIQQLAARQDVAASLRFLPTFMGKSNN